MTVERGKRPRLRLITRRGARLLGAFFLLAVICELVLRFVLGLGTTILYQTDPMCGYLPKPNQTVVRVFSRIETNGAGMRAAPFPIAKKPEERRILFIGDSVTFGTMWVDQSKIYTSLLQTNLPTMLHRPVTVLNASAGGWAIGNELGYLHGHGTYDADLVIFVVNTFDLTQPFNDAVVGVERALPSHNYPLAIVDLWARYLEPRIFPVSINDRGTSAVHAEDMTNLFNARLDELDEARRIAVGRHARFAIVYSPFTGTDWKPIEQFEPLKQQLFDWAKKSNVALLDLTAPYSHTDAKEIYFDGMHLRPKGHAAAANAMEQWEVITGQPKSSR